MKLRIAQWNAWVNGAGSNDELNQWVKNPLVLSPELNYPIPGCVPKMQRRRLSPFAKMVLSQIERQDNFHLHPSVFCTRHGDLPKTVGLIADVASGESLSPTQFALSVHNAVSGQFGIFTRNIQASTLVCAGRDSFHLGLIDAIARLQQSESEYMLYVYADMPIPEPYSRFADESQLAHCIALTLTKNQQTSGISMSIQRKVAEAESLNREALPQSLQFLQHFVRQQTDFMIPGDSQWNWSRA